MKGERTIDDKPFRYGGIMHDYDRTSEEWAEQIPEMRRCYICGGKMQNIYSPSGTLLKKTYPYIGLFRITKGKNKGMGVAMEGVCDSADPDDGAVFEVLPKS